MFRYICNVRLVLYMLHVSLFECGRFCVRITLFFAISTVFCSFWQSVNLYLLLIFLLHYYTCLLFCTLYACKLAATACHYLVTWTQSSFLRIFVHALTSVRCWIRIECFNNAEVTETGQVEHARVTLMNNLRWEPYIIPYHRHLDI